MEIRIEETNFEEYERIRNIESKSRYGIETMQIRTTFYHHFKEFFKIGIVTLFLLTINSLVYLYCSYLPKPLKYYFNAFGIYPYKVVNESQYYRIITNSFVHSDYFHFLTNMIALIIAGNIIETKYGSIEYLILSIIGIITPSLLVMIYIFGIWVCTYIFNSENYNWMVFKSGGFSNVLWMYFVLIPNPDKTISISKYSLKKKYIPWMFLIIYLLNSDIVALTIHFFGAFTGFLFSNNIFYIPLLMLGISPSSWIERMEYGLFIKRIPVISYLIKYKFSKHQRIVIYKNKSLQL